MPLKEKPGTPTFCEISKVFGNSTFVVGERSRTITLREGSGKSASRVLNVEVV